MSTDDKYFAYKRWRRYVTDGRITGKQYEKFVANPTYQKVCHPDSNIAYHFTGAEAILAPWSLYGEGVAGCMAATMQPNPANRKTMAEVAALLQADTLVEEIATFQPDWVEWVHYHGTTGKRDPEALIHMDEEPGFFEGDTMERWIKFAAEDVPALYKQCVIA